MERNTRSLRSASASLRTSSARDARNELTPVGITKASRYSRCLASVAAAASRLIAQAVDRLLDLFDRRRAHAGSSSARHPPGQADSPAALANLNGRPTPSSAGASL